MAELAFARAFLVRAALVGAAAGLGCAFTSKGEPLTPRFFSPVLEVAQARSEAPAAALDLRVGRVEPAAHLEERIAYRISDTELAYYQDRRWTEPPEQFVRRALESALFETHAFRHVVSGAAPTLDVEVLSFEELRQGAPRARLTLLISLRDERRALLDRTIQIESPLDTGPKIDPGPALAVAMADALARATQEVAERVHAELERVESSSTDPTGEGQAQPAEPARE